MKSPSRKPTPAGTGDIHPAWEALMRLCRDLKYGEIERLKIQDGVPVFAERIIEKHKLT